MSDPPVRTLAITSAVEALRKLHSHQWAWSTDELDTAMDAAGLQLHEPVDDMTIPFEHPELPGVDGFVTTIVGESTVVTVSVTLAEVSDEANADARARLEGLYQECHTKLSTDLGGPQERPRQKGADWAWDDDVLELRDLGITVTLTLAHTESRRRREGG
ncbi:DUF6301 family protein [Angustibacter sp. McL0619]|uniref:DUF6301 family protein n=1 Tax=Angustibacter sp. McL0619 TaxID=3415676 RepID=UPI003CF44071